ncbi:MAG: shikimate dehydrogenase [Clostridia bacterium]|jgi:predicted amino acid dehydrogenase|nr:shikimate dehydrogenase [Clostridia bacterium]MDH7573338.1 shikimate dehydrogenase [Clostridia bacterium]
MDTFAFMIHPLDVRDVARKYRIAARLPARLVERFLCWLPPVNTAHITGVRSPYNQIEGWFVACPLTSRQMLSLPTDYVLNRIIQAGRLAERLGAKVLGLGAMTSVVGDAGITVARNLNIPVTTGNSYTVATALEGTREAARLMGLEVSRSHVVVVGATGSIGAVCARVMAREAARLTLVARQVDKLERLAHTILRESGVAAELSNDPHRVLPTADIVISVTSAVDTVIQPADLKPGAVVCDVARPRDVSRKVAELRDDVLVIEGGVVRVPGEVNFHFDFGYPPGVALACMAETMILALERRWESFTLGREITLEQVEEISRLARRHGFELAGFRSFERPLTAEDIAAVRERARQRRRVAGGLG